MPRQEQGLLWCVRVTNARLKTLNGTLNVVRAVFWLLVLLQMKGGGTHGVFFFFSRNEWVRVGYCSSSAGEKELSFGGLDWICIGDICIIRDDMSVGTWEGE